jgi:hypothetical protein
MAIVVFTLGLYAADLFASVNVASFKTATIDTKRRGSSSGSRKEAVGDHYYAEHDGTRITEEEEERYLFPPTTATAQSPPKVALLFMARTTLRPLEGIWSDWLSSSPIDWRLMYDIHVHVSDPSSADDADDAYAKDSVFRDAVLEDHVRIEWGNHSMITAERALFKAAMKNSLVQSFVLLSEDSAPLYPALLSYMQLILEPKVRIMTMMTMMTMMMVRSTVFEYSPTTLTNAPAHRRAGSTRAATRPRAIAWRTDGSPGCSTRDSRRTCGGRARSGSH